MIKTQQYSIQNQNTETGTFYGWVVLWCLCCICQKVQKHSPNSTKLAERQVIPDCLIRRLLGKPQEDLWQITTLLSKTLKGGAYLKDEICNAENSALITGWKKKYEIGSLEWYLFILCNDGCGFLDLRFCLLQLFPEDLLQLGIEEENLHKSFSKCVIRLFSLCLAVFTTVLQLLLMKFQFSDKCLIYSVYKYWLYQWQPKKSMLWPFIPG